MAHLLMIEDDLHIAKALAECLETNGHRVRIAYTANDGAQMAMDHRPDLVLCDVMLPDATGFQTVAKLRQFPETSSTPIILMSGAATHPNQIRLGTMMGCNDYVVKPINLEILLQKIDHLLETSSTSAYVPPVPEMNTARQAAAVLEIPAMRMSPVARPEFQPKAKTPPAPPVSKPLPVVRLAPSHNLKVSATLLALHLGLTVVHGIQYSAPSQDILLNLSKTLQLWAVLAGLLVFAAGIFKVALDARSALRIAGWASLPLVLRTFLQVLGVSSSALTFTARDLWPVFDAGALASVITISLRLRWQPNGRLMKSIAMIFLLVPAWILIFWTP